LRAIEKEAKTMFVIHPYLRFALIAALTAGGVALWALFGFWYGIWFLLVALVLLVGYFILGTIGPAAKAIQTSDFDKAEKLLNLTLKPNWLYSANKAYYYILKGTIALARKDTDEGEKWLKIAEQIKLPSDNERAMIQLQLATISANKQKWNQAQIHYKNLKMLKISDPNIKEQMKQFEIAFENRGQAKAAMRMGGQSGIFQPGGKRRRPKMR